MGVFVLKCVEFNHKAHKDFSQRSPSRFTVNTVFALFVLSLSLCPLWLNCLTTPVSKYLQISAFHP
jgi:hypothetical protein